VRPSFLQKRSPVFGQCSLRESVCKLLWPPVYCKLCPKTQSLVTTHIDSLFYVWLLSYETHLN